MPEQLEVRLTIQKAEARPGQMAAWTRLWAWLLEAPTTESTVEGPEKGKAMLRQSDEQAGMQDG